MPDEVEEKISLIALTKIIESIKSLRLRQMRSREDNIMEGRAQQTWGSQGSMGRSRVNDVVFDR